MLSELWEKIVTIVGIVVAIWLIFPLPEISILISLFGGESVSRILNVPRWVTYAGSIVGAIIGTLVLRKLGVIGKLKEWIRSL